ncbi:basic salivary proline-rich protein 1-like isoform X3 [Cynara cardunculus var. scolymus]|uniref:basic salivary proline-rich protein 1-like isoform X3 n=1 Tax=Cynara cardunculus var. scolymus TaxID=59895 RepID=UPI000D6276CE|nr:basic salivary proline-rich protein 1-like isoform X3 [Cynara cardunculus var. scolymus]
MEEDEEAPPGWPSPPTPKKVNMESGEPKELVKDEDHSEEEEEESKQTEDDDEDEPPPGWQQQQPPSPPLLDMIDLPPSSPLPPTPPLPSSPRDLNMEQQDSEEEGPPPGWDNKCELKEQVEQLATPAAVSAISSDIKREDAQQDARDEDGSQPQVQEHTSSAPELVPSDIKVEQEDSEDEGPPPGWDSKCQIEPKLQMECQTTPLSDIKKEDVQQDGRDEDGSQPQAHEHPSRAPELVPSDIKVEKEDSEDEGPPPGWYSKCRPEPELQLASQTTPRSAINHIDPLDFKMENDQQDTQDEEGPPPGWGSTTQQQSQDHSSFPSPKVPSGTRMGCEQNNVKVVEERPQQPSRQPSVPPTKPQISAPKPPTAGNNPEMGQMVCGSCRRLLSYPRGARYVECACCLEENYVLEEHEVGQVVCEGCNVLLMYPYGAPKVRCANCRTETEIIDQNRRPPLSEQRRRVKRHLKRMQSG